MLRIISALAVEGLLFATAVPPARLAPTIAQVSSPADPVDALHRTGEELFDAGDYAGARVAWTEAYERVAAEQSTWPYRTTLLSLIVTATLSEFSSEADRSKIREVAELVDTALASELDDETRASIEEERERLDPYLDPVPSPAAAPRPDDEGLARDSGPKRERVIPSPVWFGTGGVLLAGGAAALVAGSRFEPRAREQVSGAGDSSNVPPGSTFISEERRKGTAWMATGGTLAAIGMTALVVGIVQYARDRTR